MTIHAPYRNKASLNLRPEYFSFSSRSAITVNMREFQYLGGHK